MEAGSVGGVEVGRYARGGHVARGDLASIRVRVLARLVETWDLPAEAGPPATVF